MKVLITGATGFFGGVLKRFLASQGVSFVNFDLYSDVDDVAQHRMFQGDLTKVDDVDRCFAQYGPFDAVCHVAAQMAHDVKSSERLWECNVTGTEILAQACQQHGVRKLIFTSTNCLWGVPLNRPVKEGDVPQPIETYGRSKWEAEKVLKKHENSLTTIIFRSPTIIDAGRLGLLAILFEFIYENRRIPVVGHDLKPYQFIDAQDYARAIYLALLNGKASDLFHIGSDHAVSLEEAFQYVITQSGSASKIYHIPKAPSVFMLKVLHALHLSPLGPYHYRMIAEEFVFDTSHLKQTLNWNPTRTNGEILLAAYRDYQQYRDKGGQWNEEMPAHRKPSSMGVIRLLKWFS